MGTFGDYMDIMGERRPMFRRSISLSVLNSFFEAAPILAIVVAVDALLSGSVTTDTLLTVLLIMGVSVLGQFVFGHRSRMIQVDLSFNMAADIRMEIGDRMKYMPMGDFGKDSLSSINTAMTTLTEELQEISPTVVDKTLRGIIMTLLVAAGFTLMSPPVGGAICLSLLAFLLVNHLLRKVSARISSERVENLRDLNSSTVEYVQGAEVIRSFNMLKSRGGRLERAIDDSRRIDSRIELKFIPYMALQKIIVSTASVATIAVALMLWTAGSLSAAYCLTSVVAAFMVFGSLETAGETSSLLKYLQRCMAGIKEVLRMPLMESGTEMTVPERKDIAFENVTFSYGGRTVLRDVSFEAREGTVTAIVGPSGSGKTTVCNLAARFWDPQQGRVTVGGRDLRDFGPDVYLSEVSMVFQRVYMFNDTIANNIKFGKPGATDEEMYEASRKACCHEFIAALPEGYNTVLGEGGSKLSGGERQRLSIARAILKDAPIVLLDEATANVDPENEDKLRAAVYELTAGKTIIMIAHRLKTVRAADQILVMDGGSIVQRGTHGELMGQDGIYRSFVDGRNAAMGWKFGTAGNSDGEEEN